MAEKRARVETNPEWYVIAQRDGVVVEHGRGVLRVTDQRGPWRTDTVDVGACEARAETEVGRSLFVYRDTSFLDVYFTVFGTHYRLEFRGDYPGSSVEPTMRQRLYRDGVEIQ